MNTYTIDEIEGIANSCLHALINDTDWPIIPVDINVEWSMRTGFKNTRTGINTAEMPLLYVSHFPYDSKPCASAVETTSDFSHYTDSCEILIIRNYLVEVFLRNDVRLVNEM